MSGFVQVVENMASHGICYSNNRPENLWNLSEGLESHGKAICLAKRCQKQALISVEVDTSTHFIHYNAGK